MEIKFNKYHGCGNDFIIIEHDEKLNYSDLAIRMCNRHVGIGADGLIIVKRSPLEMVFYNQDGSRGSMCGNGLRCFAKYCFDSLIVTTDEFDVITLAGIMSVEKKAEEFKINLGKPSFSTTNLQMNTKLSSFLRQQLHGVEVSAVFIGTIHVVIFVESLEKIIETDLGSKISQDAIFKDRSNVNFVEVIDRGNFKLRTYERGVGWTLACGTGASAALIIGILENRCDHKITVHFQYGQIEIEKTIDDNIYMSGPSKKIGYGYFLL